MTVNASNKTNAVHTDRAKFHDHPQFFSYNKRCVIANYILMATLAHCLDFFLKCKLQIYKKIYTMDKRRHSTVNTVQTDSAASYDTHMHMHMHSYCIDGHFLSEPWLVSFLPQMFLTCASSLQSRQNFSYS